MINDFIYRGIEIKFSEIKGDIIGEFEYKGEKYLQRIANTGNEEIKKEYKNFVDLIIKSKSNEKN